MTPPTDRPLRSNSCSVLIEAGPTRPREHARRDELKWSAPLPIRTFSASVSGSPVGAYPRRDPACGRASSCPSGRSPIRRARTRRGRPWGAVSNRAGPASRAGCCRRRPRPACCRRRGSARRPAGSAAGGAGFTGGPIDAGRGAQLAARGHHQQRIVRAAVHDDRAFRAPARVGAAPASRIDHHRRSTGDGKPLDLPAADERDLLRWSGDQ